MYNIFKDIQKEKKNAIGIAKMAIICSFIFCIGVVVVAMIFVKQRYDNIYVADSESALHAFKIRDIKENRFTEIDAFLNDFVNLSFRFINDRETNNRQLNLASTFVADQSFKLYVDNLNNSDFWQKLSTYDLMQIVKEKQGRPLVMVKVISGVNPFQVEADFTVEIIKMTTKEINTTKHVKMSLYLYGVPRTPKNPHGFRISNIDIQTSVSDK